MLGHVSSRRSMPPARARAPVARDTSAADASSVPRASVAHPKPNDALAKLLARAVDDRGPARGGPLQRMMGSYEEWYQNVGQYLGMRETNRDRFRRESQARASARTRQALPGGSQVLPNRPGEFVLFDHPGHPLGTLQYSVGPLDPVYITNATTLSPALEGAVEAGQPVLQITGFHSAHENTIRGIGSALLGQLVETADALDCDHIVVLAGINHPVYEAFGFTLIDAGLETWWMRTSDLKARVQQRPVRAGNLNVPRPRFREAPL